MAAHFSYTLTVQLEYTNHLLQFFKIIFLLCLALCLMLSVTYYAQNYAGIIGWSLLATCVSRNFIFIIEVKVLLCFKLTWLATKGFSRHNDSYVLHNIDFLPMHKANLMVQVLLELGKVEFSSQ